MNKLILVGVVVGAALLQAEDAVIRVTLLGTGSPVLSLDRFGPSLLVEAGADMLLFDCGRGVSMRLSQLGDNYPAVDKLFLTHLHSDHTEGFPDLWTSGWPYRWDVPMKVWGPKSGPNQPSGTQDMMQLIPIVYATDVHLRRDLVDKWPAQGIMIQTTEIEEGVVYSANGLSVTAFLVDHRPVDPAYGYRVDYKGHSMVFSGDTKPSDNLVRYAAGTDLLVHEVYAYLPADGPQFAYHTSPEQAAGVFNQAGARMNVFTHVVSPITDAQILDKTRKAGFAGPLAMGVDLMQIEIRDSGVTTTMPSSEVLARAGRLSNPHGPRAK